MSQHEQWRKYCNYYYIIYCNHCIQCLKRFFLMHHTMFQHAEKVPTCGKQYSCNHYIQYFKRKFILMYHKISLHEENSILYLPPPNLILVDSSLFDFLPSLHTLLQKTRRLKYALSARIRINFMTALTKPNLRFYLLRVTSK